MNVYRERAKLTAQSHSRHYGRASSCARKPKSSSSVLTTLERSVHQPSDLVEAADSDIVNDTLPHNDGKVSLDDNCYAVAR